MRILIPVDGSPHSVKALEVAADMARTKPAEMYVVSVVPSIGGMEDHEISPHRRDRHVEVLQKRADEAVDSACEFLRKRGLIPRTSRTLVTSVSIPDALIDFVEEEKIDLIVLGSKGLSGSSRFKVGSIANHVIKYSPCSVYLVKMQAEAV